MTSIKNVPASRIHQVHQACVWEWAPINSSHWLKLLDVLCIFHNFISAGQAIPLESCTPVIYILNQCVQFVSLDPDSEFCTSKHYWKSPEAPPRVVLGLWPIPFSECKSNPEVTSGYFLKAFLRMGKPKDWVMSLAWPESNLGGGLLRIKVAICPGKWGLSWVWGDCVHVLTCLTVGSCSGFVEEYYGKPNENAV